MANYYQKISVIRNGLVLESSNYVRAFGLDSDTPQFQTTSDVMWEIIKYANDNQLSNNMEDNMGFGEGLPPWVYNNNTTDNNLDNNVSECPAPVKVSPKSQKKTVKFIVGEQYKLRSKSVIGEKTQEKIYICKQKVHQIENCVINAVIMKQISGPQYNIYTLNKNDCKMLHVKFEPGLQVLSTELNWIAINKK